MRYEWNPEKRQANLDKHGFDFMDAWQVLEAPHICKPSARHGEQRFAAIGQINALEVAVIYTQRGDVVRIISVRRARENERKEYRQLLQ